MISRAFARSSWRSTTPTRLWGLSWWSSWQDPWRLRRVPFFEAAILDACRGEVEDWLLPLRCHELETKASIRLGQALIKDASFSDALGKLARHEATLLNALTKTLLLLQQHCSATREPVTVEAVALPAAA